MCFVLVDIAGRGVKKKNLLFVRLRLLIICARSTRPSLKTARPAVGTCTPSKKKRLFRSNLSLNFFLFYFEYSECLKV